MASIDTAQGHARDDASRQPAVSSVWSLDRRRACVCCVLLPSLAAARPAFDWFDGATPNAQAHQAVRLLEDAASHGLEPSDYAAGALRAALARPAPFDADEAARLAQVLSDAMLRYLDDLHRGRLRYAAGTRFAHDAHDRFDAADALRAALAMRDPALAERAAGPRWSRTRACTSSTTSTAMTVRSTRRCGGVRQRSRRRADVRRTLTRRVASPRYSPRCSPPYSQYPKIPSGAGSLMARDRCVSHGCAAAPGAIVYDTRSMRPPQSPAAPH